jgi:hypothetical protein
VVEKREIAEGLEERGHCRKQGNVHGEHFLEA